MRTARHRRGMANRLFVTCQCGKRVTVTAGMSGSEVECECGQRTLVPTLRTLSEQSAQVIATDTDTSDPIAAIRAALENSQPPAGSLCIVCQCATQNTIECELDGCQGGPENVNQLWITRFLSRLFGGARRDGAPSHEESLRFPVRICAGCFRRVGDLERSSHLLKVLNHATLFREIKSRYPRARYQFIGNRSA